MTGTDRPLGVYILVGMAEVASETSFGFEEAEDNLSLTTLKGIAMYTSMHIFHLCLYAKLAPTFLGSITLL